jgi:hypothetical protein
MNIIIGCSIEDEGLIECCFCALENNPKECRKHREENNANVLYEYEIY